MPQVVVSTMPYLVFSMPSTNVIQRGCPGLSLFRY